MMITKPYTYPAPLTGDERDYWQHIIDAAYAAMHKDEEEMHRHLDRAMNNCGHVPDFLGVLLMEQMEYDADYWEDEA